MDKALVLKKKLVIQEQIWQLLEKVEEETGVKPAITFDSLMRELRGALMKGRSTLTIPTALTEAWALLQATATDTVLDGIDLTKLARNKRGTGFEGVYLSGSGYVINAKDPTGMKIIRLPGRYPTAEEAAWARYQHYREHGLPYGELEREIDAVSKTMMYRQAKLPESRYRRIAIWNLACKGVILPDLSPEDRVWETTNPTTDATFWADDEKPATSG